jgi:hypothetical protein
MTAGPDNYPDMVRAILLALQGMSTALAQNSSHDEGSIAAGDNYVDVAHGLGVVPTYIGITPLTGLDSPYEVVRASTSATIFRLALKGGLTTPSTAYFLWRAIE